MVFQNQEYFSKAATGELAGGLQLWRDQLLVDQAAGDAEAIELDRIILDHYLDGLLQSSRVLVSSSQR